MRVDSPARRVRYADLDDDVRFAAPCPFTPGQKDIPDLPAEDATARPAPLCGEYQRTPAGSETAAGDAARDCQSYPAAYLPDLETG